MENKTLLSRQVVVILWLFAAAISAIEVYAAYLTYGFTGWRLYFFAVIFIVCATMFLKKRKQRDEGVKKN